MAYFAMPYRVLLHDTMAQGSHHFLTNFKFQCEVREHFSFARAGRSTPSAATASETAEVVTLDAYSRNLGPVTAGETVGILMSSEDLTPATVRLCFRVVRYDAKPVACGFQTLLCTPCGAGQAGVSAEPTSAFMTVKERLRRPSFKERVLAGGAALKQIFDEESIRIATTIATGYEPKIVPELVMPLLEPGPQLTERSGPVFLFPGQGSWEPAFVRSLLSVYPPATAMFERMDRVAAARLGCGFLAACRNQAEASRLLVEQPDVALVAIFAASTVAARYLIDRGVEPGLLLGYSFGELAALCVGGAIDDETGAEIVCRRVRALQGSQRQPGGMHAVFADEARTLGLIEALAPSTLEIAVVNHAGQTVVSGTTSDLLRFRAAMEIAGLVGAPLKSRYPLHSALLQPAAVPFADALSGMAAKPLHTAVYSAVDRGLYGRVPDLSALARHLVRPAIFSEAVECVYAFGGRSFIELSGGRVLSGLVREILRDRPGVTTMNTFAAEIGRLRGGAARVDMGRPSSPAVSVPQVTAQVTPIKTSLPPLQGPEPIAIVATGCLLPGAANPEALWRRVLARQDGIVDLGDVDTTLIEDFKAERGAASDKTYSLLCGRVDEERDADPVVTERFPGLPAVGRFFAQAAAQCVTNLRSPLPAADRVCCVVGATADGSGELDEALVHAAVEPLVAGRAPAAVMAALSAALERSTGRSLDESSGLACPRAFTRVARTMFGSGVSVLAVDAAQASSLHAIRIGIDALRDERSDLAICGGAFAPGPASICLLAQSGSATGSRPFDAADGVVFGEGSALVALKRLSDAVAAGDRIHAVIRDVACSSDGASPSVMEATAEGQRLAIRRAGDRTKIAASTLQFIDAHATASPVGNAIEFTSLSEAVGPPSDLRPRVRVGSLTGAIGHAGVAAGAAAVVELCQALLARTFPPQLNFSAPNPTFDWSASNLAIQADAAPWPANADGAPRRAAINSVAFGGANAHLVLEEFEPRYHARPAAFAARPGRSDKDIAIVGMSSLFPDAHGGAAATPRFRQEELCLPSTVRIPPAVVDQMDASHALAIKCAQSIADSLPAGWEHVRPETGVVVGFDAKTRRGIDSLLPIYRDRLARRLEAARAPGDSAEAHDVRRGVAAVLDSIRRLPSCGPHTLAGVMPNIIAGRVANALNLHGPSLVIDGEGLSLYQALAHAEWQLRSGACRFVFAGAVGASAGSAIDRIVKSRGGIGGRTIGESAVMVALTPAATASELGLPVLGYLAAEETTPTKTDTTLTVGSRPVFLMGAEGADELSEAIAAIAEGGSVTVRWQGRDRSLAVKLTGTRPKREAPRLDFIAAASDRLPGDEPLDGATVRWLPAAPAAAAKGSLLTGRRVVVLTHQPMACLRPAARAALGRADYRVVCPADRAVPGGLAIDIASAAQATRSIQQLDAWPYDTILIFANANGDDPMERPAESQDVAGGLRELMLAVTRHAYERLGRGQVVIGAICLNAFTPPDVVHPLSVVISSFLRSLAVELPLAPCTQVNVSGGDLARALDLLDAELSAPATANMREVCVDGGRRFLQQAAAVDPVGVPSGPA